MRITESQLRKIIRQEARRLTEMPARRPVAGRGRVTPVASPDGSTKNYRGETFSYVARNVVKGFMDGLEPYVLAEDAIMGSLMDKDFEPGYTPSGDTGDHQERMNVISDNSEIIYNLVVQMNPEAGVALRQGLDDFSGF